MAANGLAVLAIGGNALIRAGERGTAADQLAALRAPVAAMEPLLREAIVVTHGNGPQVGNELIRQERAAEEVPPLPLWLAAWANRVPSLPRGLVTTVAAGIAVGVVAQLWTERPRLP